MVQRLRHDRSTRSTDRAATALTGTGRPSHNRIISPRGVIILVVAAGITAVLYAKWWIGSDAAAVAGLPDQGIVTTIGLPIAEYLSELAGVVVLGVLFIGCLAPNHGPGPSQLRRSRQAQFGADRPSLRVVALLPSRRHLARMAARWGVVWAFGTASWIVFTVSDLVGVPVSGLVARPEFIIGALGTSRVLAEIATFWVALLVAMFATRTSGSIANVSLMFAAAAALLPSALTGHASHHNSATIATIALAVHILAAAIWVGGLFALIVHLRPFPNELRLVVQRFSAAALVCVVAVGLSGIVVSYVMLGGLQELFGTGRGELILAKTLALVVLCAIGYQHRRGNVDAASSGRLGPLLRLGAGELALMGATIGIAVVLSTTG